MAHVIHKIQGERHLTFEESTISQWLYLQLKDQVDELLVCNPVYVAKKPGAKTDFRDALHLAQELRTDHLMPVYHDNSHWIQLRVSVSGYQTKRFIPFEDYQDFLRHLQTVFRGAEPKVQEAVIKTLIHKVEVNRESEKIHYIVDKDHIKKGGPVGSPSFFFEYLDEWWS